MRLLFVKHQTARCCCCPSLTLSPIRIPRNQRVMMRQKSGRQNKRKQAAIKINRVGVVEFRATIKVNFDFAVPSTINFCYLKSVLVSGVFLPVTASVHLGEQSLMKDGDLHCERRALSELNLELSGRFCEDFNLNSFKITFDFGGRGRPVKNSLCIVYQLTYKGRRRDTM